MIERGRQSRTSTDVDAARRSSQHFSPRLLRILFAGSRAFGRGVRAAGHRDADREPDTTEQDGVAPMIGREPALREIARINQMGVARVLRRGHDEWIFVPAQEISIWFAISGEF